MRKWQRGQVGAEFALTLAFLFAAGVAGFQFLGVGLTALKVSQAAQEAAYVAASEPPSPGQSQAAPCWALAGGLQHPEGLAQADVCRTVVQNLGDLNPSAASLQVKPMSRPMGTGVQVEVTYTQPVDSPFLRLFLGPTFVASSRAQSA